MPQAWHNVRFCVEIMMNTEVDKKPTELEMNKALIDAFKNGQWVHVTEHQIIHTVVE